MNNSTIYWVIGHSAVGKEAFISHLVTKQDQRLLTRLGISTSPAVAQTSLKYLCSPAQTTIRTSRRNELPPEVNELTKTHQTVLIKYQFVDSLDNTIDAVRAASPEYTHIVIHLTAPKNIALKRLLTKSWWDASWNVNEFYNEEITLIDEVLSSLNMRIITVESQDKFNFTVK